MTENFLNNGSCIVVLETSEHVAAWVKLNDEDSVVVALSAEADEELDALSVKHLCIEDFYSDSALMVIAENTNSIISLLCDDIDTILGVNLDDGLPDFSAHYHAGRLRILYDTLRRVSYAVVSMLEKIQPSLVFVGDSKSPEPTDVIIRRGDFISFAFKVVCEQRAIPVRIIRTDAYYCNKKNHSGLRSIINRLRHIRDFFRLMIPRSGDLAIYYWPDEPRNNLKLAGIQVIRLPQFFGKSEVEKSRYLADHLGKYFKFSGCDFSDLAKPHLEYFMGSFRSLNIKQLKRTERIVSRSGVCGSLAVAPTNPEAVSALIAARRMDLPAIVIQHGGFNGYANYTLLPLTDLGIASHYFCYGPMVASALKPAADYTTKLRPFPVAITAVGSSMISKIYHSRQIAASKEHKKLRVIYIVSALLGSSRTLAGHVRPDIRYWRLQRRVLSKLIFRKDWEIHFRPSQSFDLDPVTTWLKRQDNCGVILRNEKSLNEIFCSESFDLIITDAVATVLLEALATSSSIIANFDPEVMNLDQEAERLLRRRVVLSFTEKDYLNDIENALDHAPFSEIVDDAFLFSYALTSEDPVMSMVSAIQNILGLK